MSFYLEFIEFQLFTFIELVIHRRVVRNASILECAYLAWSNWYGTSKLFRDVLLSTNEVVVSIVLPYCHCFAFFSELKAESVASFLKVATLFLLVFFSIDVDTCHDFCKKSLCRIVGVAYRLGN